MSDVDRQAAVAATADHIRSVVAVLRELEFGDTPPALAYRAERQETSERSEQEKPVAAV
ncbi:hypothetical protein OG785_44630 [Streptomyces sp. NBC_00006]|uniref:hypothetical protein n=1 Tax=unclassified Streptomyces TaxID=2593676 RepID=UPI002255DD09|nr:MULTISPECIES: hypothetical protein [unclassified Streptomyces]MCX5537644.1 hypothetical protein [Streptomyces sp. NBC_00006]